MTSLTGRSNRHGADDVTGPIQLDRSAPQAAGSRGPTTTTWLLRVALLIIVAVVGILYLYPRIYDLTATPYRLDAAVESANNYNPALDKIVEHETVTLAAFGSLDEMKASLADVLATDAAVSGELNTLIEQISVDVQGTLDLAGANVTDLISSLDTLTAQIESLQPPVDDAAAALTLDRTTLDEILVDAQSTADKVHSARVSAEESANDLSGK